LGAGVGGTLRYAVGLLAARWAAAPPFLGTLVVNVVGAFAIGALIGQLGPREGGSSLLRLFLATGVLGGFTTFSAFSVEVVRLLERGEFWTGLVYAVGSVAVALIAVLLGQALVRA